MKRRKHLRNEETPELNLIPIMNLFVCLVPFLLLTAVFVKMGGVKAEMPVTASSESSEATPEKKEQIIDLVFQIDGQEVELVGFTDQFQKPLSDVHAKFQLTAIDSLDQILTEISSKYPKWRSTLFKASPSTRFEDAISVLSKLRANNLIKNLVLAAETVR